MFTHDLYLNTLNTIVLPHNYRDSKLMMTLMNVFIQQDGALLHYTATECEFLDKQLIMQQMDRRTKANGIPPQSPG